MVMNPREKLSRPLDKRRKTDLDVFVLALIEAGVSTPYELQKSAQLSQGATSPVLERLLESRLILAGQRGPRGRVRYKVSAAGKRYLARQWRVLLDAGPVGDIDADLRVALLSIWFGGKRTEAADFLLNSALTAAAIPALDATESQNDVPFLAVWYTELRVISSRKTAEAECEAIAALAKVLPRSRSRACSRYGVDFC